MRRAAVVVVIASALVVSLAGCESNTPIPTPSPSAVIGTWRHGSDVVTINADGTFDISDMPAGVISQSPVPLGGSPTGALESVTGTWSIGSGGTDVGGAPGVQLDFVRPKKVGYNYGLTLIVADGSPLQLYVTLGRPDSGIRYTFSKK
jgi:hypothetical protein